jgi:hypothetical protein
MSTNIDTACNNYYASGVVNADNRVNTSSASYTSGYNAGYSSGVTDADSRVNTSSASYTSGYNNGYSVGNNFTNALSNEMNSFSNFTFSYSTQSIRHYNDGNQDLSFSLSAGTYLIWFYGNISMSMSALSFSGTGVKYLHSSDKKICLLIGTGTITIYTTSYMDLSGTEKQLYMSYSNI